MMLFVRLICWFRIGKGGEVDVNWELDIGLDYQRLGVWWHWQYCNFDSRLARAEIYQVSDT